MASASLRHHARHVALFVEGGEGNDFQLGAGGQQLRAGLEATLVGQVDVEEHHVGLVGGHGGVGFGGRGGGSDHGQARQRSEQGPQPRQHHRVVINEQNTNRFHSNSKERRRGMVFNF
jgi:hypothetical protein